MKLIIGLGNPGSKYIHNRHNAGYMLVDQVHSSLFIVKKTNCFMNDSGKFIVKAVRNMGLQDYSNLYVAHDDLDLKLGTYKIQFGVGPKVHNGIRSIEDELGTKDFWRIRIGIESRILNQESSVPGEKFVLEDFTSNELKILEEVYAKIRKDFVKS